VGEDIFAALLAVSMLMLFILALARSYGAFSEQRRAQVGLGLALDIADQLRNNILAKHGGLAHPGLINPDAFENELPKYADLLNAEGIGLHVEVRSLDDELILEYGPEKDQLGKFTFPSFSVRIPVSVHRAQSSKLLGMLIVRVWGI